MIPTSDAGDTLVVTAVDTSGTVGAVTAWAARRLLHL